jgi:hypothetical protein
MPRASKRGIPKNLKIRRGHTLLGHLPSEIIESFSWDPESRKSPPQRLAEIAKTGGPLLHGAEKARKFWSLPPKTVERVKREARRIQDLRSQGYTVPLNRVARSIAETTGENYETVYHLLKRRDVGQEDIMNRLAVTEDTAEELLENPESIRNLPKLRRSVISMNERLRHEIMVEQDMQRPNRIRSSEVRQIRGALRPRSYVQRVLRHMEEHGKPPHWAEVRKSETREGENEYWLDREHIENDARENLRTISVPEAAKMMGMARSAVGRMAREGTFDLRGGKQPGPRSPIKISYSPFLETLPHFREVSGNPRSHGFHKNTPASEIWEYAKNMAARSSKKKEIEPDVVRDLRGDLDILKKRIGHTDDPEVYMRLLGVYNNARMVFNREHSSPEGRDLMGEQLRKVRDLLSGNR